MSNISKEEWSRYERQMQLPGVGATGQSKIKNASVLVVGAGGLGCPALTYLTSAGIGTIGIADHDTVAESNLHRQPLYKLEDIGALKSTIATQRLKELNPHIHIVAHEQGILPVNAVEILSNYDIVLDCTDRFDARYLMNDVCLLLDKPMVHGSLFRFQAQIATFNYLLSDGTRSATYRCLFPKPPSPHETTDCKVAGVFGFLPGLVGSWMASETINIILEKAFSPKLLLLDIEKNSLQKMELVRNPESWANYPKTATEISAFDYGAFCSRLT
ncbi:MAG: HesA/MoeB/ThiF family protein [Bacteroidota bacterium]|jgi:molybdopterin/thiamine biosynthesis adenylyltransferase